MPESSCLCGANRISYNDPPIFKFRCHCSDERKLTGAVFALNIFYSDESLKVLSGELKVWGKKVDSGNTIYNHSCGQCGSLLRRTSTGYPGMMVIKAGCMDGKDHTTEFVPDMEIFTRNRAPFIPPIEGAKQYWGDFENLNL